MSESPFCVRELLAEGCVARVERCGCGALHLTLGALTLRFHEPALRSLTNILLESVAALEQSAPERPQPLPQSSWGSPIRGQS